MASRAPRPSWTNLPSREAASAQGKAPDTVLDWLAQRFPRVSRETWRERMEGGLVTDSDRQPIPPEAPFVPHLRVAYFREVKEEIVDENPLRVLCHDDHLVVVDKPPFLPVVPGGGYVRGCLLYRLEEQLGLRDLSAVHRLDRGTSGVVLFTQRPEDRGIYAQLFARGQVERTYSALAGVPERPVKSQWRVESRIVAGEPFFRMMEMQGEPNACTAIELVDWRAGVGRFLLRPESGKKHQLRLHMARLGWPILGDRLYPELQPEAPDDLASPLRLVAQQLSFIDPIAGDKRDFQSRFEVQALAKGP